MNNCARCCPTWSLKPNGPPGNRCVSTSSSSTRAGWTHSLYSNCSRGRPVSYDDWARQRKETGKSVLPLPFIFPFVLYHGESGWTVSTQFADLVFIPEELKESLRRYALVFEHLLVDLGRTEMEQIRGTMELRLVLGLLKGVSQGREEEWFEKIFKPVIRILEQPDGLGFMRELFEYLMQSSATVDFSTFREMIARIPDERTKADVMTLAEKIFAEGRDEGWQKGRNEGWQKGRDEGWQKGRDEGWQKARQIAILDVLEARFGTVGEEVRARVASLTADVQLSQALRAASVSISISDFLATLK